MKTKTLLARYCLQILLLLLLHLLTGFLKGASAQIIDFGKSYINVSKGQNGGTVETGDTLEIRASLVVRSGTYDSCGYYDAIPAGTSYIPGTVRVLTNEGKIYKQFTDAMYDDEGWINGTNIRINLGFRQTDNPARWFRRGRVRNNNGHKPSFYNSATIQVASFRVVVTAPIGSTIYLGGGSMTYRNGGGPVQTFNFPSNAVAVYTNYGICSNSVGVNSLGTEFNGTFGSGPTRNRGASANVPPGYGYQLFTTNTPNDYTYGIANNTSTLTNYTTLNTWPKPDNSSPSHRVFGVWDIIGDHTGAADPVAGNPASDTVNNSNGGYMLVVNAAYRIDSAFQHTISNLCPNTYYEISCWMRNICSKCGCDSNGRGATGVGYIPTGPGDSSGVSPNITFEVDGVDYYTTGNLDYSGEWVKKGFTFLTGPTQTSFTLKFFNNAPGGGGNDWALDDITVATCTPNLELLPSEDPVICADNPVEMSATISSFFNNYTYYKWEESTDGGLNWTNTGVSGGPETPSWNGSAWEYTVDYPPFVGLPSDSGKLYRVVVATTAANLSNPACSFNDAAVITVNIINCGPTLATNLLSFGGTVQNGHAQLNWSTTGNGEPVLFDIERSNDGINFTRAGMVAGRDGSETIQLYSFVDPDQLSGRTHYRLKMYNGERSTYSRTVILNHYATELAFTSVINPFNSELYFSVSSPATLQADAELIDVAGNSVRKEKLLLNAGMNSLTLASTEQLPAGVYTLRIQAGGTTLLRRVMKQHN